MRLSNQFKPVLFYHKRGKIVDTYVEKESRLNLDVTNSDNEIKFQIDCFNGTQANVSLFNGDEKELLCGEAKSIGKASALKGKTVFVIGAADNPDGEAIKIVHKIFETNGNSLTYIFPDDYTGTPQFDKKDDHPDYKLFINLR